MFQEIFGIIITSGSGFGSVIFVTNSVTLSVAVSGVIIIDSDAGAAVIGVINPTNVEVIINIEKSKDNIFLLIIFNFIFFSFLFYFVLLLFYCHHKLKI